MRGGPPSTLDRETALRILERNGITIAAADLDRLLVVANGRPLPATDLGDAEPASTFDPAWR